MRASAALHSLSRRRVTGARLAALTALLSLAAGIQALAPTSVSAVTNQDTGGCSFPRASQPGSGVTSTRQPCLTKGLEVIPISGERPGPCALDFQNCIPGGDGSRGALPGPDRYLAGDDSGSKRVPATKPKLRDPEGVKALKCLLLWHRLALSDSPPGQPYVPTYQSVLDRWDQYQYKLAHGMPGDYMDPDYVEALAEHRDELLEDLDDWEKNDCEGLTGLKLPVSPHHFKCVPKRSTWCQGWQPDPRGPRRD